MKTRFTNLTAIIFLIASSTVEATQYVSNLDYVWPLASIGDIEGVFHDGTYGAYSARFATGAGVFSLNHVTLEFFSGLGASAQWLSVQLYQQVGNANLFIGGLGNPTANPTPTQWPQSTTFIDYTPTGQIILNPFSHYSVVISMPSDSPVDAALMFAATFSYRSLGGWSMSATTSGNPFVTSQREFLMLGVDATVIPEQSSAKLGVVGLVAFIGSRFIFGKKFCPVTTSPSARCP